MHLQLITNFPSSSSSLCYCFPCTSVLPHRPPQHPNTTKGDKPMYVPSIAVLGVLKPRPTSLYHLRPAFPTRRFAGRTFWAVKMCGCFWKARSDWTVSSVAIFVCCCGRRSGETRGGYGGCSGAGGREVGRLSIFVGRRYAGFSRCPAPPGVAPEVCGGLDCGN